MDMDLLLTVQRLAEMRAATKLPTPFPPPRISLRQRTAERIAAEEARIQREAALQGALPRGPRSTRAYAKVNPHAARPGPVSAHGKQARGRVLGAAARRGPGIRPKMWEDERQRRGTTKRR
ncbi:hypothetical protein BBO_02924 [Beauveria brongniartii RCEF 3172]|uniref:Uncharacterized protein n=1 Tax=Beauveria brongniartii RCEF 3172 TaxID=1081107 RepID=A0A167H4A3_9HYPO|nr:hypothetical protein BBO_02924 [Beauveria brongniartii RCEF 3172]